MMHGTFLKAYRAPRTNVQRVFDPVPARPKPNSLKAGLTLFLWCPGELIQLFIARFSFF